MRILFLGAGPLARPVFNALVDGEDEVVGLVTQPDRTGQGHHSHENPLKTTAESRGIPCFQPKSINAPEELERLRELRPDLTVVAAYGQLLSQAVLDLARLGTINVHASLLPKYRGATPIHAAVLNGDAETGVTIIRVVKKLDAGPMLGAVSTPIGPRETTGELEARLAELAIPLTIRVIRELDAGRATETPQVEELSTHCRKFTKQHGAIDWTKSAVEIERHLRGMQPWPGPFSHLQPAGGSPPQRLQLLAANVLPEGTDAPPGTVVAATKSSFSVQTGAGTLEVLTVQPDGKKPMASAAFLNGRRLAVGDRFVTPD